MQEMNIKNAQICQLHLRWATLISSLEGVGYHPAEVLK